MAQLRGLIERGSPQLQGAIHALNATKLIDDGASCIEIADEIRKSPELSSGVMALASSVHYGGSRANSVKFAVEILGYDELRRALLSLAITSWANCRDNSGLLDLGVFRRRAVTVAFMAEAIARALQTGHYSKYYVAGMFADIGYVFLAGHMPYRLMDAKTASGPPQSLSLIEAETMCLGFSHVDVSAMSADIFKLDGEIVHGIASHHAPCLATGSVQVVADVVHVAAAAADAKGILPLRAFPIAEIDHTAYERLGLTTAAADLLFLEASSKADVVLSAMKARVQAQAA